MNLTILILLTPPLFFLRLYLVPGEVIVSASVIIPGETVGAFVGGIQETDLIRYIVACVGSEKMIYLYMFFS